jgi:uncharacterized protein YdaU (DUF1376 family)
MAVNHLYMPFHFGDYMADAGHLDMLEHGAYFLLIGAYWQRGGPLPANERVLRGIVKASPEQWVELAPIILPFFQERDGLLHHKRIDDELAKALHRSSAARANAERLHSARRAGAKPTQSGRIAGAEPTQSVRPANQDQEQEEAIASSPDEAKLSLTEMVRRLEQATGWLGLPGEGALSQLVVEGHSFEDRVLPLARDEAERRHEPPKSWTYLAAVVRDATRKPTASAKPVDMVWVAIDSDAWKALAKVKKEGWLRMMLKPDGKGGEGIWWPAADLKRVA